MLFFIAFIFAEFLFRVVFVCFLLASLYCILQKMQAFFS